jgi:hypothetical protein
MGVGVRERRAHWLRRAAAKGAGIVTDVQRQGVPDASAPGLPTAEVHRFPDTFSEIATGTAAPDPAVLPWAADRLPLIIGTVGHRDLREDDLPRLRAAVTSALTTLRRQYLDNDRQTPMVILSALAEGADQLIAAEGVKLGATLIAALPLPLAEYRRDFTQKAMTTDAPQRFEELFEKVAATVELPLAAGSTEGGIKAFGPERDRQYREANLFIAKHCHVLIALYDGNDDDVTVGSAAEAVSFCREGIPVAVKGPARPILDGSDTIPVIHIVTPRKAVRTTASEVRVVPWGSKVKGAPGALGKALSGAGLKRPWELSAEEARIAGAWTQFRAFTALTTRFNREARIAARKRDTAILGIVSELFGGNPQAHARGEEVASLWSRFYGIGETLAREREKRVRADWRDMFLLGFAAFLCFAFYSHLFPVNLLLFDYAAIAAVVGIIFYRSRRFAHRERCFDYRALADALRVGVFWKMLGVGMNPGSGPGALPHYRSMAEAYPIAQQNELAWVKSSLRALDLTDRIGPPPAVPRVLLDTYDWVREIWVGQQREHYRAVGARYGKLSAWGQRWFVYLMAASVILAAVFSAIDIRDEWTGSASTIMAWATAGAGFVTENASFLPAALTNFIDQFAAQTYPILVLVIALLPGLAAAVFGYSAQMAYKAQSRYCAQMAFLFDRALGMLPEADRVGRKSIMAGALEPDVLAYVQAVFSDLGTSVMRESAGWVALHRDHVIG